MQRRFAEVYRAVSDWHSHLLEAPVDHPALMLL
eukprot:COSAG06_NODE_52218_length_307_cov_0.692308_1_plen_32_part_10